MDILYILGEGSQCDNNELRYSLRSLSNCFSLDRVYIIGTNPNFLSEKVKFSPYLDLHTRQLNHFLKVKKAFETTDITDNILLMYDDVFFTKQTDIEKYPNYFEGELPDFNEQKRSYIQSLGHTKELLKKYNKKTKDFSVHCPIIYNKQKFLNLYREVENDLKNYEHGIDVRSLYCNWYDLESVKVKDCIVLREQDFERVKEFNCFSINDTSLSNGIGKLVAEKYKIKSIYEV